MKLFFLFLIWYSKGMMEELGIEVSSNFISHVVALVLLYYFHGIVFPFLTFCNLNRWTNVIKILFQILGKILKLKREFYCFHYYFSNYFYYKIIFRDS